MPYCFNANDLSKSLFFPDVEVGNLNIKTTIEEQAVIFDIDYPYIKEVIVVNDCSIDNTKQIVESLLNRYPKLILINNIKN